MNQKKEFLISLCFFLPVAAVVAVMTYQDGESLTRSVLMGCMSGSGVFFVPYIFRRVKKKHG